MKKSFFRPLIAGMLLLSLAVLPLYAGGAQDESGVSTEGKKTIVFWNGYTGPDRPAVEELVAEFNRMYPDVEVKMEIMPWDSLWQKLMPALISGKGPDVMGFPVFPSSPVRADLSPWIHTLRRASWTAPFS
jgi:multiple sugar transport system substrate-binding protein